MAREIGQLGGQIDQPVVRPFLALHIDLPDPVRVFTGEGVFLYDDAEWVGAGGIGAIDAIGESSDGSATGIKAQLLNVPSEFRDDIADQAVRGVLFEVFVGTFDETFQRVGAFQLIWKGRLDQYNIVDAGTSITVEVTGESRQRDQFRPAIKRFTDEYQQRKYPGDMFFEYVPQMVEVQVLWAKAEPKPTSAPQPSGGYVGGFANSGAFRQ